MLKQAFAKFTLQNDINDRINYNFIRKISKYVLIKFAF